MWTQGEGRDEGQQRTGTDGARAVYWVFVYVLIIIAGID